MRQDAGVDHTSTAEPETASVDRRRGAAGWRGRLRRTPGGALVLRAGVFLLGLLFILLGVVLIALPGPLTIPPMLIGVWIWSSEFAWADRLFERAKASAREAWEKTKRRPVLSALVTLSGLVAVGAGLYLISRYDLVDRASALVGL